MCLRPKSSLAAIYAAKSRPKMAASSDRCPFSGSVTPTTEPECEPTDPKFQVKTEPADTFKVTTAAKAAARAAVNIAKRTAAKTKARKAVVKEEGTQQTLVPFLKQ